MSYGRDRDATSRGVGAIAALDGTPKRRMQQMRSATALRLNDARMAQATMQRNGRVAMGAIRQVSGAIKGVGPNLSRGGGGIDVPVQGPGGIPTPIVGIFTGGGGKGTTLQPVTPIRKYPGLTGLKSVTPPTSPVTKPVKPVPVGTGVPVLPVLPIITSGTPVIGGVTTASTGTDTGDGTVTVGGGGGAGVDTSASTASAPTIDPAMTPTDPDPVLTPATDNTKWYLLGGAAAIAALLYFNGKKGGR